MKNSFIKSLALIVLSCSITASLVSCGLLREDTQSEGVTDAKGKTSNSAAETATAPLESENVPESDVTELTCEADTTYEELMGYINANPRLNLLDASDTVLTSEQYISLCEAGPEVKIIANVIFEGLTLNLSEPEIDISENVISDKAAFDTILSNFPAGTKLVMCDCGYTNEEMQALREKYPELDFAWRIYMGKWSLRTDDEAFSVMIYDDNYVRMTENDIEVLKYCTNMYALDLGHQAISDVTVLGELTTLRVLILADNLITDITPLSKLKNLQYLELFVNRISDLSPLAECTELVDLNFGWNRVYDLSTIYSLEKIERLWLPTTNVPASARDEITAAFPNAQIVFEDVNSISSGWRTHERYFSMRGMFTNNKYDENFVK